MGKFICEECGLVYTLDDGIATHDCEESPDGMDHDIDAGHVPYGKIPAEYMVKIQSTKPTLQRWVVCAAIKSPNGGVICSPRHYDAVMRAQMNNTHSDNLEWDDQGKIIQGFVDQRGVFMDRDTALQVAEDAGQIVRRCEGDDRRLYSVDLY